MPDASSRWNANEPDRTGFDPLAVSLPSRREVAWRWLAMQPLVPPAVGLVAGIWLDSVWPIPWVIGLLLFVLSGLLLIPARQRGWLGHPATMLAALAVGTCLHDLSFRRWPDNHIVRYSTDEPILARIEGTVLDTPRIQASRSGKINWIPQSPSTRFLMEADRIMDDDGGLSVSGWVSVVVREPVLALAAGDRVRLLGWLSRLEPPSNPGGRDWSLIGRRQGILLRLSCPREGNVEVLEGHVAGRRFLNRLRLNMRGRMLEHTYPGDVPGGQLLSALVLGQRSAVDEKLNEAFIRTGTVHYLSVSGAHVGMLMSALWLGGMLLGRSRRECAAAAMIIVTLYALLAEPRPSILRAALMANLFCISILLRRPTRSLNWLAAAAIILLVARPTQLFEPGFQLSFFTLIGLIFVSPRLYDAGGEFILRVLGRDDPLLRPAMQKRINPNPLRDFLWRLTRWLGQWLSIGLAAWLVSMPICVYHFQQFSVWGWLNTILIAPLVWLVLILGLLKTVLAGILLFVADWLGMPLRWLTDILIEAVYTLSDLPASRVTTPLLPWWLVLCGLGVIGLWLIAPWLRWRKRWPGLATVVLILLVGWQLAPPRRGQELRLHVLSVGNGLCCLMTLPDGKNILYDIGSMPPYDLERWTLGPLLARERIYRIDAVLLSHANLDHYSALPDLLERRRVGRIVSPPHFVSHGRKSRSTATVMREAADKGLVWETLVRPAHYLDAGTVTMEILWPPPEEELEIPESNDTSLVVRINYAGRSILLSGDIEQLAQGRLLAEADLKADVLVLPHHGGMRSNTRQFIESVNPRYCLRSSGRRDRDTDSGLLELMADRRYFNTADDGALEVRITPTDISAQPFSSRKVSADSYEGY
ncbi:MAG: ComEC/Rec2 family competence protein [Phycisphaerales bacterium]|nr:ComEC/Rec2 family competence protein [Phycisphaerales bacterium]